MRITIKTLRLLSVRGLPMLVVSSGCASIFALVACGGVPSADAPNAPVVAHGASAAPSAPSAPASASTDASPPPPTRIHQCNVLIEKVNAAGSAAKTPPRDNNTAMGEMADAIDGARAGIAAVVIQDARLARYKDEYLQMLDDISGAARRMQEARGRNDMPAMKVSLKQIQAASDREKEIVNALNTYCKTGE